MSGRLMRGFPMENKQETLIRSAGRPTSLDPRMIVELLTAGEVDRRGPGSKRGDGGERQSQGGEQQTMANGLPKAGHRCEGHRP